MSNSKDASSNKSKSLWKVSLTPKSKKSKKEESESESEEEEESEVKVKPLKEQKRKKGPVSDPLAIVNCTACARQINPARDSVLRKHPDLSVLICKKCWSFYHSGEITKDEDGSDEQCRWCGEGGKLIGCDFCHNVFCKSCILRNFGRAELSEILDESNEDAKWKCYVCDDGKLKQLVEECDVLFKRVAEEKHKAKKAKKTNGVEKKSSSGNEFDFTLGPSNIVETVNRLSVITNCFQHVIDAVKTDLQQDDYCDEDSSSSFPDLDTKSRNAKTLENGIHSYLKSLRELLGLDKKQSVKDRVSMLKKSKNTSSEFSDITDVDDGDSKTKYRHDKFKKSNKEISYSDEDKYKKTKKKKDKKDKKKRRDSSSDSEDEKQSQKNADKHSKSDKLIHKEEKISKTMSKKAKKEKVKKFNIAESSSDEEEPIKSEFDSKECNFKGSGQKRKQADISSDQIECDNKKSKLNDSIGESETSALFDNEGDKVCNQKKETVSVVTVSKDEEKLDEKAEDLDIEVKVHSTVIEDKEKKGEIDSKSDKQSSSKSLEKLTENSDDKYENQAAKMALIQELAEELCKGNISSDNDDVGMDFSVNKETSEEETSEKQDCDKPDNKEKIDGEKLDSSSDYSPVKDTADMKGKNKESKEQPNLDIDLKDRNAMEDDTATESDQKQEKSDSSNIQTKSNSQKESKSEIKQDESSTSDDESTSKKTVKTTDYLSDNAEELSAKENSNQSENESNEGEDELKTKNEENCSSKELKAKKSKEKRSKDSNYEADSVITTKKTKSKVKGCKKEESHVKKTGKKVEYNGYYNDDDVSSSDLIMSSSSSEDFQPSTSKKHGVRKTKKVKKGKKDKLNSSSDEDSDSDFDYKKSKKELKKNIKEGKEAKKKAKERRQAKEMEESDSDSLDKEIDKLEKDPERKKKKSKKEESEDDSNIGSGNEKKKLNGKGAGSKEMKKKKAKVVNDDDSSDDTDGKNNKDFADEDSSSDDDNNKTLPMPKMETIKDENEEAKKDLMADLDGDDSSSIDEDSDEEVPKKKDKSKKTKVKEEKEEENSDSDFEPVKKKRFRSSLLDAKIESSDSDKPKKKKKKKSDDDSDYKDEENESDESDIGRKKKKKSKDTESESETESDSDEDNKKKKRKRIKNRPKNSSDEGAEDDEKESPTKGGRKKIRKVMSDKKVADATKAAAKAEEDRRKRVELLQKKFNIVTVEDCNSPTKCPMTTKLVLESDKEGEPLVAVNKHLIKKLKPHQVEAVQFMWSCCIESLKRLKKEEGSGCILAHCMGLGKTLSVVSFVHTVLSSYEHTNMTTCLIVSPLNTVLNWRNECTMWLKEKDRLSVCELSSVKDNHSRARYLRDWIQEGGIMIIGYEMYRNLTNTGRVRNKRLKKAFEETLVDPGPDLVVCDEGHILKNEQSAISQAMNKIKTKRRIILTGTPLQNNLNEYHCMVSFVKPRLLGTRKEFLNRFVNPITNGQCSDSTAHDVRVMKRRAHVLHEMLAGCVQRKDYSALTKYLPPKLEYVISVRLAPVQMTLYEKYLETAGQTGTVSAKGGRLFQDYQALSKIWTHPWVLKLSEIRQEAKIKYDDEDEDEDELSDDSFIDDSSSDSSGSTDNNSADDISLHDSDSDEGDKKRTRNTRAKAKEKKKKNGPSTSSGKTEDKKEVVNTWKTRSRGGMAADEELLPGLDENDTPGPISNEWWAEYLKEEDKHKLELSGKLTLLFKILSMCEEIGDKVLVFSQSLLSLDIIEDFLDAIDKKWQEEACAKTEEEKLNTFGKSWTKGADYFRMDGSTSVSLRQSWAEHFNDPENYRARLFIISTKAGGLGINLVGANRAIIFDASWNPSHDIQSIFRVYRFGQVKPVYIYRFLAQGTMEEKIYERQVTKQSLSQRVVDEHQIERHFTANDLQELYAFRPDRLDDPNRVEKTPILPKDTLLAELLKKEKDWIVNYHEHDSLLENKIDETLTEEERKSAWEEYETDKDRQPVVNRAPMMMNSMYANGMMANAAYNAQMSSVHQRAFSAENVSQVVQLVRSKFPYLQGDMFQAQVQNIIMQQIMQYNQQQENELVSRQRQEMERLRLLQSEVASKQRLLNQAVSHQPPQEIWVRPKNMPATQPQTSRSSNMTSLIRSHLTADNSADKPKSKTRPIILGDKTPEKNPPPAVDLTKS